MPGDYGINSPDYKPALVQSSSGLIGKIARQIIEAEEVPEVFGVFNKEPIADGKDVEITIYEQATGKAYSQNGENPAQAPDPKGKTLILNEYIEQSYSALIDNWNIAKAAIDSDYAARSAAAVVQTLYAGYAKDVNEKMYTIMKNAQAGTPNSDGTTNIVSIGDVPEVKDEETAREVLLAIKTAATGMKVDPKSFNPYAFEKKAERVALIIPYETRIKIDTYLYANTRQVDYVRYDVDDVVEVPATEVEGAIFVVDVRYIQKIPRRKKYDEAAIFNSGGNIAAGLAISELTGCCPFYCGVKLAQAAATVSLPLNEFSLALDAKVAANAKAARMMATQKTKVATKK